MSIVAPTPTSVYLYYDHNDFLIYVGITSRGVKRQVEHNASKEWWQFVARQEVEHFDTRPEAAARERFLIETHTPPFNTQHNRAADQVRSAYLLFRAAHSQPMRLRDAVRAMEQKMWLDVHQQEPGKELILRTRLSDVPVSAMVSMPDGPCPRVYGFKKSVNKVIRITRAGPITLLHLGTQTQHPLLDAYAVIRFGTSAQSIHIRNVHVRLDHSDPTRCNSRCSRTKGDRPEVRWVRPDGEGRA